MAEPRRQWSAPPGSSRARCTAASAPLRPGAGGRAAARAPRRLPGSGGARRRGRTAPELVLSGGGSAILDPVSVVQEPMLLLALDAEQRTGPRGPEVRVRVASAIEPEWLLDLFPEQLTDEDRLVFSEDGGARRAPHPPRLRRGHPRGAADPRRAVRGGGDRPRRGAPLTAASPASWTRTGSKRCGPGWSWRGRSSPSDTGRNWTRRGWRRCSPAAGGASPRCARRIRRRSCSARSAPEAARSSPASSPSA